MHREKRMLGRIVKAEKLPWSQKWRRHFRGLDFSKTRHHTPYAPSGVFAFGFGLLVCLATTVNVVL